MMRRVRRSAQFLIAVAVLAVGACSDEAPTAPTGGPPDPGAPPPPATNTPASATITSDGGTLQASGADGSSLRLTFPEGALVEPVAFTVTSTAPGSARARYLIAPFGLTLLAPVTLELVLPEGIPLEGGRLAFIDGDDRTPMPITIDPATRTVRATTLDLGYSVGSAASADRAARFAGLAASPLATSHNTPTPLEYDEASCSLSLETLRIKRSQTQTYYTRYDPDFPEFGTEGILSAATMRGLHQTFIQTLEDCGGGLEASFVEERDLLQGISCESYADARRVAGAFQPALGQGGTEDHWSILNLLLSWAEAIELTGAACSNPVPVEETMEPVWDRYIDDYAARLDRDGMDLGQWRRTWAIDLTEAITLKANVQYFGLSGIETAIDQELMTRMFDLLRLGAFDRCREDGEQGYFVDIMNGGGVVAAYAWPGAPPPAPRPPPAEWRNFTLDAVKRDVQLCGTRIDVTVFDDVPEELVDQAAYLGRGNTLNSHEDEASINLPSGGALLLSGEVRPLRCLSRTATARWSNDDLVVRLEGHEVARRSHTNGDFLHIPLDLPLPGMLEAAGLPEDTSGELTLTLVREGEACEAQYGDPTTTIATIELNVDEAPTISVRIAPGQADVRWGETLQFTATVEGTDDQRVTWTRSGGSISETGLYSPGPAGDFTVRATSVASPSHYAEADVHVIGESPYHGYFYGTYRYDERPDLQSTAGILVQHWPLSLRPPSFNRRPQITFWFSGLSDIVSTQVTIREDGTFGPISYQRQGRPRIEIEGAFNGSSITGVLISGELRAQFEVEKVGECPSGPPYNGVC